MQTVFDVVAESFPAFQGLEIQQPGPSRNEGRILQPIRDTLSSCPEIFEDPSRIAAILFNHQSIISTKVAARQSALLESKMWESVAKDLDMQRLP